MQTTIEADEAKDQSKFQDQQLSFTEQIKVYTEAGDRNAANKIQQKLDRLPNPANKKPWKERRKAYETQVNKLQAEKAEYVEKREELFSNIEVDEDTTQELARLQSQRDTNLTKMSNQIQELYNQS